MTPHNLGLAFTDVARGHAERVALHLEGEPAQTYEQLDAASNQLARHLLARGVQRRDVIALMHDKSAAGYIAMLACLKLGAVYVNLDEMNPPERLKRILDTARPKFVLSTKPLQGLDAPVLLIEGEDATPWHAEEGTSLPETHAVTGMDPAYLMYTSGSTGVPKGAVIPHGAVLRFVKWIEQRFEVTPRDVLTGLNPAYFDNSVFDFYGSLFNGASLAPVKRATAKDALAMVKRVEKAGCTIWFSVPSMLVYANTVKALGEHSLPALRTFVFGGEGFPKGELGKLFQRYSPRIRFVNVYGPTECTCICSAYDVTEADVHDTGSLAPLGHLNPDFSGLILDDAQQPVQTGGTGELWLGGPQVGLGYYNDPERTAASFVQHPLHGHYPERLYRTGDLVKLNEKGLLEFAGRRDNQIKHLGYRIELEEIEAALCRLPYVAQAGAIYRRLRPEFGQIEAFVAVTQPTDAAGIRNDLRAALPDYMVPRRVVVMDTLPKNSNGKVDRRALEAL